MKRFILLIITPLLFAISSKALNYETAKQYAWDLTDKMAYELDLTDEQYDRVYQINLDYLMSLDNNGNNIYGTYWNYRSTDLRYVLVDWQYNAFTTIDYFFRPISWLRNSWYYPLYKRYERGRYFFGRRPIVNRYYSRGYTYNRPNSPHRGYRPNYSNGMRGRYNGNNHYNNARPNVNNNTYRPAVNNNNYNRPSSRPSTRPSSNSSYNNNRSNNVNRNSNSNVNRNSNSSVSRNSNSRNNGGGNNSRNNHR